MKKTETIVLKTIEDMLQFYKNYPEHIFFVNRPLGNLNFNLTSFIPNFEIIHCYDRHHGQIPFIQTLQSSKTAKHYCQSFQKCQQLIMNDHKMISYIKSKGDIVNIFFFLSDSETEALYKVHQEFNVCNISSKSSTFLENKINSSKIISQLGFNQVPYRLTKVKGYKELLKIGEQFNTNHLVVQTAQGFAGYGTCIIADEKDYQKYKQQIEQGEKVKVMPFKKVRSFAVDVVALKNGIVIGPLLIELIGHEQLTSNKGGYCGNQLRKQFFETQEIDLQVKKDILDVSEKLGRYLYDKCYVKGTFGIDFLVDVNTNQVYFQEINARLTGPVNLTNELYSYKGQQLPYLLFHLLEYLNVQLDIDFKELNNNYFLDPKTYEKEFSLITLIRKFEKQSFCQLINFPQGIYKRKGNSLQFCQKLPLSFLNIQPDQIYVTSSPGTIKRHIFKRNGVQDQNLKLFPQAQELIALYIEKYQNSLQNF